MNTPSIIFSVLGILTTFVVFQIKNKNRLLIFNALSNSFYTLSMLFLGAYIGALLLSIAILRDFIYIKLKDRPKWYVYTSFMFINVLSIVSAIFTYGHWFDIAILLASILINYGMWQTNAIVIRVTSIITSITFIIYNIIHAGYLNIITEALVIISCVIFLVRLLIKYYKDV
ncbi:MAG: YgjV family protein [Firmicutes bacterium]|nr:YgjV family protein [Bacillota bacterium]